MLLIAQLAINLVCLIEGWDLPYSLSMSYWYFLDGEGNGLLAIITNKQTGSYNPKR